MNVVEESWAAARETFSENQLRQVDAFKASLQAFKKNGRLAKLLSGRIEISTSEIEPKEMSKLEGQIINSATTAQMAVTRLQILKKVILQLRERKIEIPFPRRRFVHKPAVNPIPENIREIRAQIQGFVKTEAAWIKRTAPNPPLELVVCSAILHSGLLSTSSVVAFVEALLTPEKSLRVLPLRVCVDLSVGWRGKMDMEHRILELDDQTAALLRVPGSYAGIEDLLGRRLSATKKTPVGAELLKKVFAKIRGALSSDSESGNFPSTLARLLDTVSVAARSDIPGVLVDYASGSLVAHSLKPESASAVYGPGSRFSKPAYKETRPLEAVLDREYEVATTHEVEMDMEEEPPPDLLKLRDALRNEDLEPMLAQLGQIDSALPSYSAWFAPKNSRKEDSSVQFSIWKLLVQFAIHLLTSQDLGDKWVKKGPLKPRTAEAVVLRVARTLGHAVDKDVRKLSPEALETLYTQLLENAVESYRSRGQDTEAGVDGVIYEGEEANKARLYRNALKNSLRKFHFFLEIKAEADEEKNAQDANARNASKKGDDAKQELVKPRSIARLLMAEAGLDSVSAHVLTLEAFFKARQIINGPILCQRYPMYLLEYVDAMLILGFRLGLRRWEALGLEAGDVSPNWVLVHPSDERDLKTPNSKRKLPLYPLLPRAGYCEHCGVQIETDSLQGSGVYCNGCGLKDELGALLDLRQRAQKLLTDAEKFLFHEPSKNIKTARFEIVTEDPLLDILCDAIQKASGDSQLHMHSLRHSFASHLFLRLMVAELDTVPNLFPHLEKTNNWMRTAREFRRDLYLDDGPTRKHARAVSSLLGHAGPIITTESYLHFFDRLLLPFLAESSILKVKTAARVGAAVGLKPDEISKMRRQLGEADVDYRRSEQRGWGGHIETGLVPGLVRKQFPFLRSNNSDVTEALAKPVPGWRRAAWFLHRHALRRKGETLDSIAKLCDLEPDRASSVLRNWKIISEMKEADPLRNPRHPRHKAPDYSELKNIEIDCPRMPSQDAGRELVEVVANQIADLASTQRKQCHDFLLYYISNVWGARDWVTFKGFRTLEFIKEWRRFLQQVLKPLKSRSIQYHLLGRNTRNHNRWKEGLRLRPPCIPHIEEWYGNEDSDLIGLQPSTARGDEEVAGAVAFRFAFTISAIAELSGDELRDGLKGRAEK